MHDEHQTSPATARHTQDDSPPASASQDASSALTQLDIKLRTARPKPLPDPFQFAVYLANLAGIDGSL